MYKILSLFTLSIIHCCLNAADLQIDMRKLQWIPSSNSSNTISFSGDTAKLSFKGKKKGYVDENGIWFYAKFQTSIRLDKYQYLLFRARSTDGKSRSFTIYLRRELSPGNLASFYTITELTPEWRDYNLKLERGDRVNFGKGIFALHSISPGGSSDLSAGGRILNINYALPGTGNIEMKNLRLGTHPVNPDEPVINKIVSEIKSHKKFIPYTIQTKSGAKVFTLAESGRTFYRIQAEQDAVSQFAASELAKYLKRASGVDFIVDDTPRNNPVIRLKITIQKPEDGFSITVDSQGNILIAGNNGRGLIYGIYDFLERVAGCRFFGPFDYLEVVPKTEKLTVPEFHLSDAPLMDYRFPHYCNNTRQQGALAHIYAMADYCTKNRYNVELQRFNFRYGQTPREVRSREFYAKRGGIIPLPERWGHNFHIWLPPEQYFAKHPEYYCYDRATRSWRAKNAQLCTTNPEVAEKLANIARKQFAKHPELTHFGVMQEDGHRLWCQCDKCLAINPSRSNLGSATDNNLFLANAVAKKIGPEKRVMTYAYAVTASPPKAVTPLPNVDILYCQYGGDSPSRMPWEDATAREILEWAKLSNGNLNIYSYNYLTPFYTFPNAAAHIASFRYYNLLGIRASTQEMFDTWHSVNPYQYYLSARLAWNPWFDEDKFRQDYFQKLYGPASKAMEEIYLRLDQALSNRENQIAITQWEAYTAIPDHELQKCWKLLALAETQGGSNQRIQAAINAQKAGIRYLEAVSKALNCIREYRLTPSPANCSAATDAVNSLEKQVLRIIPQHLGDARRISYLRQIIEDIKAATVSQTEFQQKYHIVSRLNHGWKFMTDLDGKGDQRKYYASDFNDRQWHDIKVGSSWEKQGFPDYDGTGWYRIKVEIPPGKHKLLLYFGAADERAWVYFDGKYIGGQHEGDVGILWKTPFTVSLPESIPPGKHQLTVKVIDTAGQGGLYKDVFLVSPK